jgi:hypothetical protein
MVLAALAALACPALPSLAAPTVKSSSFAVRDTMPVARPDFPVPTDPNMLFFIQRSTNSNTVVYTANIRADGRLDPDHPVQAFWRRFNTTGERKALGFFEAQMAYGVRARRGKMAGEYEIRFVALPDRRGTLRQDADGTIELTFPMRGQAVRPGYAYVEVNEAGIVPSVERVTLHGTDLASGKVIVETMTVSGGEIGN